jgi:hypothetical protein
MQEPINLPATVKVPKWKHSEPVRDFSKESYVDELLGKTVDGVIVAWKKKGKTWGGFVRVDGYGSHGSRDGVFIGSEDILSDIQPDIIHPGTRVRLTVSLPTNGGRSLRAQNVDVYKDED